MARIARKPLELPAGVKVKTEGPKVLVEGPKGKLQLELTPGLRLEISEKSLVVEAKGDDVDSGVSSRHGLTRSLVQNMIKGVSKGFEKKLEIRGVGYRAAVDKGKLTMSVGFSHPVVLVLPPGITVDVEKLVNLSVKGVDKYLVGEMAARIRRVKPPEVYKGTGIRYLNEMVRQKVGKAAASGKPGAK
jgi:large subunit ribosomal protein L6